MLSKHIETLRASHLHSHLPATVFVLLCSVLSFHAFFASDFLSQIMSLCKYITSLFNSHWQNDRISAPAHNIEFLADC